MNKPPGSGETPPRAPSPVPPADPGRHPPPPDIPRRRVPTILQMEGTECGAAALAMVMAHHGLHVPMEKLRVDCGISRDGSNARNLMQAARAYGFEARAFRMDPGELATLRVPLILFWEFNHFVVLEGRRGDIWYLHDPASGPRPVTTAAFDGSFTGIALQIVPGPGFKPGGTPPSLLRGILGRLAPLKPAILYVVLASLLLAVPGMILPSLSRIFVDDVLGPNPDWLAPLLLALGGTTLVMALLTALQRAAIRMLTIGFLTVKACSLFEHLLRLPMSFFMQRNAGEIQHRIGLNDSLAEMICGQVGQAFTSLFMLVFYGALLLAYDVPLALLGIAIAAVNLLALSAVARRRRVLHQSLAQEQNKLMGMAISGIQLMETIKASGAEADFFARWAGQHAKNSNAEQRVSTSTVFFSALPALLAALNNAAILVFGAWRVMDGDMTIGMLVAFQALMGAFLAPVAQFTQLGAQRQQAKVALDKLNDVEQQPRDPAYERDQTPADPPARRECRGELELRDIRFGYSPVAPPLLDGFSLHIRPGRRIAVVGRSGSGKSTVARIAAGLYRPWSGEVLLDGIPLADWPRKRLEGAVAMVDQDIVLFRDSLRDNLSMWNPLLDEADILQACHDAEIHADIANRPGGYGAPMNEGGANFSGGQRQRIEIARALANHPALLILDEATSSLDAETERRIDAHLRHRGCSCLLVAHRLSTIRDCDEILVLDNGRIVQRGRHDDLIQDPAGAYARLITAE